MSHYQLNPTLYKSLNVEMSEVFNDCSINLWGQQCGKQMLSVICDGLYHCIIKIKFFFVSGDLQFLVLASRRMFIT